MFDEDDFAAALARLDELGAAEPTETRTPDAENDAATVLAQAWELIVAGRVDEIGPMCADDAVVIDRQRIVGEDLVGRDAIVGERPRRRRAGRRRRASRATRGARLRHCPGPDHRELRRLRERVPERGRARRPGPRRGASSRSTRTDLVDALDELDARYFAGEGAALARDTEPASDRDRGRECVDDWDGFRDPLRPDLV